MAVIGPTISPCRVVPGRVKVERLYIPPTVVSF